MSPPMAICFTIASIVCFAIASSSYGCDAAALDLESDFRYVSYNDLMASGVSTFRDEGVTSFGQLLFDASREQVFVGARDNLYRISLKGLKLLEKTSWNSPQEKISLCQDKGQSENDCRNYVKVLLTDGSRLFACGTNAFSPQCSWRKLDNITHILEMVKGEAKCPYNPNANITTLMTRDGQYYVGTPTDFAGSDPAIYRTFGSLTYGSHTLRTNQYNSKWLNQPQFVGSFEDDKFIYFIFRETAVEYINCGKRIYSRVARVCKNDMGGEILLRDNWTTFFKARLNCSKPGDYPFYYDEIQDVVYLPEHKLLYGIFTTSRNSIAGSAICTFNMTAIDAAFKGPFKHQEQVGSSWESKYIPHLQHTQCQKRDLKSNQYTEFSRYQLMDNAVQSSTREPLHTINLEFYTHISVAVVQAKYSNIHVIFVSNEDGVIKKISVLPESKTACLVEVWKPDTNNFLAKIKTMHFLSEMNSLYIGTEKDVVQIPVNKCNRHVTQVSCLGAQDPFCGWDGRREVCSGIPTGSKVHWYQDVPRCPDTSTPLNGEWSAWSQWEQCLQKNSDINNDETQDKCLCQTRTCNNPAPRNGGKQCTGISISVTNCTVHGGWTAWSGWSACSASCGVAVKWRRRACGAPTPQHGGRLCVGTDRSEIYCTQNPPCPAPMQPVREGGWSDWASWSACSAPCGGGVRWRQRKCDSPEPPPGAPTCSGCSTEAETCNRQSCDSRRKTVWSPWQYAQSSNISEGGYIEKRYKFTCKAQSVDPVMISMSKEEVRYCTTNGTCGSSPQYDLLSSVWTPWSYWSNCSVICGGGYQTATRTCLKPPCQGNTTIQRSCNTHSCMDGWGCWSDWTQCTVSCGAGRTERRRPCLVPGGCKGDAVQTTICEGPSCESLLGWSEWSQWSKCDSYNKRHRRRHCLMSNLDDAETCQGPDTETKLCNINDINNELFILHNNQAARGSEGNTESERMSTGMIIGLMSIAVLVGALLAIGPIIWIVRNKTHKIPSSPHYITKQNSYVSVPLKEVPKKRVPSFSGICSTTSGLSLSKPNNINSDRDGSLDTPKLYPKAIAGEYETATVKRNSHSHNNGGGRSNIDIEQDRFY